MKTSVVGSGTDVSRRTRFIYLPLVPFILFTSYFLIWPILAVTIRSLKGNDGSWTFSNFRTIMHGSYLHAFLTSIKLALTTAAIGSIIGAFIAYVIVRYAGTKLTSILDSISAVFANSGGVPLAFMFIASFGVQGMVTKWLIFMPATSQFFLIRA